MPITQFTVYPSRLVPATFSEDGDAFLGQLATAITEANALEVTVNANEVQTNADVISCTTQVGLAADQVVLATAQVALAEDQVALAEDQVALAEDQVALAEAAGNFKGLWASLTGAATVPYSVYHLSKYWQLASNLADVQSKTPGTDADWIEIVTGGGGMTWTLITADPNPAVTQNGYICNTTGGAFTVTLPPAPDTGDVVGFTDASGTFDSLNLTIGRNSLKIMGLEEDMIVSTKYAAFSLVYASTALGWRVSL